MTSRPLFSIEKTAGEDEPSIHLYFGSGETRVQVASTPEAYEEFVRYLGSMTREITETFNQH